VLSAALLISPAKAGSTTAQFDVTLTIQAGCEATHGNRRQFHQLQTAATGTYSDTITMTVTF
jgi:spore coat protein U-like protein